MSKDQPQPYKRRVRETKELAQRLDLGYLKRRVTLASWKSRLIWLTLALAGLAAIAFTAGLGGTKKALARGPLSAPHALFEARCEACHANAFRALPDSACLKCHDGPAHPAKAVDLGRPNFSPACAQCHVEHRGDIKLTNVSNGNCTACHGNLTARASNVKLKNPHITAFRLERHPEFSPGSRPDLRPLKLNHAAHMPAKPKVVRNMKLPMHCGDCHATDPGSSTGSLLPVTFEQNCKSCHARELEFDVYQVLGASVPAPHTKDPKTIHEFILATFTNALAADPGLVRRPLGNEVTPQPNAAAWLEKAVTASEAYLFQNRGGPRVQEGKCSYCHEFAGWDGALPLVQKVNRIEGRYVEGKPNGEPWFERGEFNHRTHRAIQCDSCHTEARTSAKTSDILIPTMKQCLPCHSDSRAGLDRCSECHIYHNRGLEKERERRSSDQLLSSLRTGGLR